jgi:amidohydrolase
MTLSPEIIKHMVNNLFNELVAYRRHFHANPELSYHEKNTASYISSLLAKWNIEHKTGVAGYGITGILKGKNPAKKIVALRADMDALPVTEKNNVPYRSMNEGVMHACGHDVHMTCLLGTLKILNAIKEKWEGSIKFIFQPAEEKLPGGAQGMIKEGVLQNPKPQAIIAQHVFPELEAGKVGFKTGKYMASSDEINITVKGKGGHAAIPSHFDNTVLAAAEIITSLENEINVKSTKESPTILSFGKIIADGAHNVIPPRVYIFGTFRTFDETWRKKAWQIIKTRSQQIGKKHGCKTDVNVDAGYPFVLNNKKITETLKKAAAVYLGKENIVDLDIRMTAEDFGYYSHVIPATFYRLGVANKKRGIVSNLHSDTFDVDEKSILTGTGLMIWNTLYLLNNL